MRIEDKINKFAEYLGEISQKLSLKGKHYCKEMLEDILTDLTYIERKNELLALEINGTKSEDYADLLFKAVNLLQLSGYDMIDISFITRKEVEFLLNNKKILENSGEITPQRVFNIIKILKYHEQITGQFPENIYYIVESYNEIKCNKTV